LDKEIKSRLNSGNAYYPTFSKESRLKAFENMALRRMWLEAGEDCTVRNFVTVRFTKYCWGNHINKNEMQRHVERMGDEKSIQYYG
jgi:hypothetical protein